MAKGNLFVKKKTHNMWYREKWELFRRHRPAVDQNQKPAILALSLCKT